MWDLVDLNQAATFSYLLWEICFECVTNMLGIPMRSVKGAFERCGVLEKNNALH